MKKMRAILSLLLATLMVFSMMMPMVSAAEYSDVPTSHKYYEDITELSVFGILNGFEDGTFRPEDGVTRAQFAKIICYALNMGDITSAGPVDTGFVDVDPNHWAASNIKIAVSMGIINGMGDGTFQPESPVLFEQAVKMVVCALGYSKAAEANGGYFQGHMTVAANLGLLKNSDGKVANGANRGTIANLISNMLDVDQVTGFGEKGDSIKDQTIKTESMTGQITSVYGLTIYADRTNPCSKNQIEVLDNKGDYYTFSVTELDDIKGNIADYLGKRVTVYYDEEDELESPVLTKLTLQANKNIVTKVDLADITDYSDSVVEYIEDYDSGDVEEVSISADANILYNGVATEEDFSDIIDITKPGQVTFLDSDKDLEADVVFIKEYTTMIVKSKASSTYKLYDSDVNEGFTKNDLVLDEEDNKKTITIKRNNANAEFKNIATKDVVSFASSEDGRVIDVLVSNKTVASATVAGYNASLGTVTLRASGKDTEYKLSKDFEKYSKATLEIGLSGTFYLDAFGKIVKVDVSAGTAYTYAYLLAFENVGTSTEASYAIKTIKIDGTTAANDSIVYLASKFKIDGETYTSDDEKEEIADVLTAAAVTFNDTDEFEDDNATKYCQVIKYSTNSAGQIDKIITADYAGDTANSLKVDNQYASLGVKCTTSGSKLASKYSIGNAKVLFVPETRKEAGTDKFIGYKASFFRANSTYKVQLIDATDSYSVPIILVYGTGEQAKDIIWANIAPSVVTNKSEEFFDGEVTLCIEVMTHTGEKKSYYKGSETEGNVNAIKVGDVIRIDATSTGVIQEFKRVVTLAAMNAANEATAGSFAEGDNASYDYAQYRVIIGTALDSSDGILLMTQAFVDEDGNIDTSTEETFALDGSTKVIVVDSAKVEQEVSNAISLSETGELIGFNNQPENASKVLVYTSKNSTAKLIVIFR